MNSLPLVCPAATQVSPPVHGPSVICGALEIANDGAHIDGFQSRGQVSPLISGQRDSRTVRLFCAGQGIPGSPMSYCSCEIWRAEREAGWARRRGQDALVDETATRPPATRGVIEF